MNDAFGWLMLISLLAGAYFIIRLVITFIKKGDKKYYLKRVAVAFAVLVAALIGFSVTQTPEQKAAYQAKREAQQKLEAEKKAAEEKAKAEKQVEEGIAKQEKELAEAKPNKDIPSDESVKEKTEENTESKSSPTNEDNNDANRISLFNRFSNSMSNIFSKKELSPTDIIFLEKHPHLYDQWDNVVSFYKKNDLYEKYVYVESKSPKSANQEALILFYSMTHRNEKGSQKIANGISIKPKNISGNATLEECFKLAKEYVPAYTSHYKLTERQKLIPEDNNSDKTSYYWLHYGKGGWYGDEQYSITFYVNDGYVNDITLTSSPYNMFTDYRKSRGWRKEEWETNGIFED